MSPRRQRNHSDRRHSVSVEPQRWQRMSDWDREKTFMWAVQQHLPDLPAPLQRLRDHAGVYPLLQPTSILRNSRRYLLANNASESEDTVNGANSVCSKFDAALNFSFQAQNNSVEGSRSFDSTQSSDCSVPTTTKSMSTEARTVRFDPRITVTALADRDHVRHWYANTELESFRMDFINVVRRYLSQHPDQIAYYRDTFLDPITKTHRHRPLYGLASLCDVSQNHDNTDIVEHSHPIKHDREALHLLGALATFSLHSIERSVSRHEQVGVIGRILIFDMNATILDLMHRTVRSMCDQATRSSVDIQCVSTLSCALKHLKPPQKKSFDMFICEEPQSTVAQASKNGTKAASHDDVSLCYDEFVQCLKDRKDMLLIRVTMRPSQTSTFFTDVAFDFTWGKPPPRMDAKLYGELVQALKSKRKQP
jgi:hypothetical protein